MLLIDCGEGTISNTFSGGGDTGTVAMEHIRCVLFRVVFVSIFCFSVWFFVKIEFFDVCVYRLVLRHVNVTNRKVVGGDSMTDGTLCIQFLFFAYVVRSIQLESDRCSDAH